MGRVKVRSYKDIILSHPELTAEELDKIIQEEEKSCKELTEWPEIN